MSQLFTVTMVRQEIVKKYDGKSKLVAQEAKLIPVVFHDLPLQTAQMYADKFPDAQVKISQQAVERDTVARQKLGGGAFKNPTRRVAPELSHGVKAAEGRKGSAAPTRSPGSDMAAAINAELEEAK